MFDEGYKSTEGCLFCNERCAYQYLKIVFELGWKRSKAIYVQAAIWERDMDSISADKLFKSIMNDVNPEPGSQKGRKSSAPVNNRITLKKFAKNIEGGK